MPMQIFQKISKGAHEHEIGKRTFGSPPNWEAIIRDEKADKEKDIISRKHRRAYKRAKRIEGRKLGFNNLKLFIFTCGKDIPKACFYRTLDLNRIRNVNRRRHFVHSVKMKRQELSGGVGIITKRPDFGSHVRRKVLPITNASSSPYPNTAERNNNQCFTSKIKSKVQTREDKKKPISRMKQLLRRVAAMKTEEREIFNEQQQQVSKFSRQEVVADNEQHCSESPKISFTWDVETSSVHLLTSSAETGISISQVHIPTRESGHVTYRKGNWITTDSEFVVLEL